MRFRARLLTSGRTATGVEVPAKVVEELGSRRPKVRATINGYTYRSSVASMGGTYMLGVSAEVREKAGVAGGDVVDVDLELDTDDRVVTVPPDLVTALKRDAAARRFFEGLSYSQQRWFIAGIEGAKKPETRMRRVEAAIARLREGRGAR
ncbi:MAG TPA: YdeI/OmpD-associated family protein [Actinomycetota bacterium]|nr:YdeI/OmpD-associated family protein [Actinomycetota bacterium]